MTGGFGRMTRGVFDQPEALVFRDRLIGMDRPWRPSPPASSPISTASTATVPAGTSRVRGHGIPRRGGKRVLPIPYQPVVNLVRLVLSIVDLG